MKEMLKWLGVGTGALLLFVILMFVLSAVGLVHFKIFAPRYESAKREVFEETKSYVYGAVQDLAKYKYEWEQGDEVKRRAIENVVRVRFANFPPEKINNPQLRAWFEMIISSG